MSLAFIETPVAGAFVVESRPFADERGAFVKAFDSAEFARHGLACDFPEWSYATNALAGTLRGMHYQADPHGQVKLVRCSRGAAYDVIADLRRDSPSYRKWFGVELAPARHMLVYAPIGVAHGYLTLVDDTEICYQIGSPYAPDFARGIRWDDPAFAIGWPADVAVIGERDQTWPDWPR